MAYANGAIPASALKRSTFGVDLTKAAANSANRLNALYALLHGKRLTATDGYRSLAIQKKIFLERYAKGSLAGKAGYTTDVSSYLGAAYTRRTGTAAAAIPGTSNHGLGLALDISALGGFDGAAFKRLEAIAADYGWTNTEGRSVGESWHWVYSRAHDKRRPVKYVVKAKTLGSTKAALYRGKATGKANITRHRALGKTLNIIQITGKWAQTAKGDWIKLSKIKKAK